MRDELTSGQASQASRKEDDYVFYELTRSVCPVCYRNIDAHIMLRDNRVYMRKRCPEHGPFEALVYGDAEAYCAAAKYNKPGSIPLAYSTERVRGCPQDCGLCPDHQQHVCVGIIGPCCMRSSNGSTRTWKMGWWAPLSPCLHSAGCWRGQ